MDRSTTGRVVGAIPILSAVGVVVSSLPVVLPAVPNPEPAVMLVAAAVVVRIPGTMVAPTLQG